MNRIILIGNGFDLAHGMRTSYNDFINYYWYNLLNEIEKLKPYSSFENEEIYIDKIPPHWEIETSFEGLVKSLEFRKCKMTFKNRFLEIINKKKQIQNWVDIENEYYQLLKDSFKNKKCDYSITDLNSDFYNIQKLLEEYLKKVEQHFKQNFGKNNDGLRIQNAIANKIYSNFKFRDFTESAINRKVELEYQNIKEDIKFHNLRIHNPNEISDKKKMLISAIEGSEPLKAIRTRLLYQSASDYFDLQPEEILFLNFNYTFTEDLYFNHIEFDHSKDINKSMQKNVIHIHGTTNETDNNDVIFGFGDEIDEDYKSLENLNENIYLENIKSIKYLETDNYKKLLEFLNSDDYQIFIFGHSCGNSDRTLLSTLFEHKHCVSIKPFYYQREHNDNYSEIVRNITRNFSNKAVLRDKVVNKEYCEPLT